MGKISDKVRSTSARPSCTRDAAHAQQRRCRMPRSGRREAKGAGKKCGDVETYVIDGFVIEAYANMGEVPFAECGAVPTAKSCENERADALYGFCRTCLADRSEPMLLCEQCDRAFHLACLNPPLLEVPKGEWLCSRCVRQNRFHTHVRAATANSVVRAANTVAAYAASSRLRASSVALPPTDTSAGASGPPRKRARMHHVQALKSDAPPTPPADFALLAKAMATVRSVSAAMGAVRAQSVVIDDSRLNAAVQVVNKLSTATLQRGAAGASAREVHLGAQVSCRPFAKAPPVEKRRQAKQTVQSQQQPQQPHASAKPEAAAPSIPPPAPLPKTPSPMAPDNAASPPLAVTSAPSAAAAVPKPRRGPGRPKGSLNKVRKPRPAVPPIGSPAVAVSAVEAARPKRPRGRPPKAACIAAISAAIATPDTPSPPRRGPGRPPKTAPPSTSPARRGRPPRAPGRPSKVLPKGAGPSRGPGRPLNTSRLSVSPQTPPSATSPPAKVSCGRPPKSASDEPPFIKAPRGRPPKSRASPLLDTPPAVANRQRAAQADMQQHHRQQVRDGKDNDAQLMYRTTTPQPPAHAYQQHPTPHAQQRAASFAQQPLNGAQNLQQQPIHAQHQASSQKQQVSANQAYQHVLTKSRSSYMQPNEHQLRQTQHMQPGAAPRSDSTIAQNRYVHSQEARITQHPVQRRHVTHQHTAAAQLAYSQNYQQERGSTLPPPYQQINTLQQQQQQQQQQAWYMQQQNAHPPLLTSVPLKTDINAQHPAHSATRQYYAQPAPSASGVKTEPESKTQQSAKQQSRVQVHPSVCKVSTSLSNMVHHTKPQPTSQAHTQQPRYEPQVSSNPNSHPQPHMHRMPPNQQQHAGHMYRTEPPHPVQQSQLINGQSARAYHVQSQLPMHHQNNAYQPQRVYHDQQAHHLGYGPQTQYSPHVQQPPQQYAYASRPHDLHYSDRLSQQQQQGLRQDQFHYNHPPQAVYQNGNHPQDHVRQAPYQQGVVAGAETQSKMSTRQVQASHPARRPVTYAREVSSQSPSVSHLLNVQGRQAAQRTQGLYVQGSPLVVTPQEPRPGQAHHSNRGGGGVKVENAEASSQSGAMQIAATSSAAPSHTSSIGKPTAMSTKSSPRQCASALTTPNNMYKQGATTVSQRSSLLATRPQVDGNNSLTFDLQRKIAAKERDVHIEKAAAAPVTKTGSSLQGNMLRSPPVIGDDVPLSQLLIQREQTQKRGMKHCGEISIKKEQVSCERKNVGRKTDVQAPVASAPQNGFPSAVPAQPQTCANASSALLSVRVAAAPAKGVQLRHTGQNVLTPLSAEGDQRPQSMKQSVYPHTQKTARIPQQHQRNQSTPTTFHMNGRSLVSPTVSQPPNVIPTLASRVSHAPPIELAAQQVIPSSQTNAVSATRHNQVNANNRFHYGGSLHVNGTPTSINRVGNPAAAAHAPAQTVRYGAAQQQKQQVAGQPSRLTTNVTHPVVPQQIPKEQFYSQITVSAAAAPTMHTSVVAQRGQQHQAAPAQAGQVVGRTNSMHDIRTGRCPMQDQTQTYHRHQGHGGVGGGRFIQQESEQQQQGNVVGGQKLGTQEIDRAAVVQPVLNVTKLAGQEARRPPAGKVGGASLTPQQLAQAQLVQAQMAKKRRTPEQLAQAQLAHTHLTHAQMAKKRRTPQQLAQSQLIHGAAGVQLQGEQGVDAQHSVDAAARAQAHGEVVVRGNEGVKHGMRYETGETAQAGVATTGFHGQCYETQALVPRQAGLAQSRFNQVAPAAYGGRENGGQVSQVEVYRRMSSAVTANSQAMYPQTGSSSSSQAAHTRMGYADTAVYAQPVHSQTHAAAAAVAAAAQPNGGVATVVAPAQVATSIGDAAATGLAGPGTGGAAVVGVRPVR